nr:uncharacterized protein LOC126056376 [Helicoverpa armigera]
MVKDVGILIEWLEDNFGYDLATARKHNTTNSDPVWVRELKDYLKDLTTRFKQQDIASYTNPIIASIEKKHDVKINDIDVDQYGEISINYTELKKEKKEKKKKKSSKDHKVEALRNGEQDSGSLLEDEMRLPSLELLL